LDNIEQIIALKPKIVFYGISYRDFESKLATNNSLEPINFIKDSLQIDTDPLQFNPKFTTLQAIKNIFNDDELFAAREQMTIPNTPFFVYNIEQLTIVPNDAIDKLAGTTEGAGLYVDAPEKNEQLSQLKKILNTFSENDIKVVLFIAPLHQTYLDDLPDVSRNNFELIINDIRNNYNVKIYNYTSKYSQLNIWANPDHIAYNKMSVVYSDDISQIVLGEIGS
ncbi:MAG: hypothetical protein ACRD9Q_07145, partial [Nitrososphaeraceae archaeon]